MVVPPLPSFLGCWPLTSIFWTYWDYTNDLFITQTYKTSSRFVVCFYFHWWKQNQVIGCETVATVEMFPYLLDIACSTSRSSVHLFRQWWLAYSFPFWQSYYFVTVFFVRHVASMFAESLGVQKFNERSIKCEKGK